IRVRQPPVPRILRHVLQDAQPLLNRLPPVRRHLLPPRSHIVAVVLPLFRRNFLPDLCPTVQLLPLLRVQPFEPLIILPQPLPFFRRQVLWTIGIHPRCGRAIRVRRPVGIHARIRGAIRVWRAFSRSFRRAVFGERRPVALPFRSRILRPSLWICVALRLRPFLAVLLPCLRAASRPLRERRQRQRRCQYQYESRRRELVPNLHLTYICCPSSSGGAGVVCVGCSG